MSSASVSFPQFALFPFEIRHLIWSYCLPHRVIRLRRHAHRLHPCGTSIQFHRRHLPPLIAHVCSESRAVALQHGALRSNISYGVAFGMNYAWMDTSRDVVLVDASFDHRMFEEPGHLVHIAKTAPEVALASWLFMGRPLRTMPLVTAPRREGGLMVVAREYVVHATEAEAVRSGLFGLWAEERLVLVPVRDQEQLAKYFGMRLVKKSTSGIRPTFLKASERSLDDSNVEDTREQLKLAWIQCHVHNAPKDVDGFVDPDILIETEDDGLFVRNFEHPWVKETLSAMPSYELVVLFQLCTKGDHLEMLDRRPIDNPQDIDPHFVRPYVADDYYLPPSDFHQG